MERSRWYRRDDRDKAHSIAIRQSTGRGIETNLADATWWATRNKLGEDPDCGSDLKSHSLPETYSTGGLLVAHYCSELLRLNIV